MVSQFFFVAFGLLGVNNFGGRFRHCNDGDDIELRFFVSLSLFLFLFSSSSSTSSSLWSFFPLFFPCAQYTTWCHIAMMDIMHMSLYLYLILVPHNHLIQFLLLVLAPFFFFFFFSFLFFFSLNRVNVLVHI